MTILGVSSDFPLQTWCVAPIHVTVSQFPANQAPQGEHVRSTAAKGTVYTKKQEGKKRINTQKLEGSGLDQPLDTSPFSLTLRQSCLPSTRSPRSFSLRIRPPLCIRVVQVTV